MLNRIYSKFITPFRDGKLDLLTVKKLINWQLQSGIDGFLLFSDSGEGALLSLDERKSLLKLVNSRTSQKALVGVDCTSVSLADTLTFSKQAAHYNANFIVAAPTPYLLPSQDGIFQHFIAIANNSTLPVIINNDKKRCGVEINFETAVRLSEHENIVGFMDNDGDLNLIQNLSTHASSKLNIICGHNQLAVQSLVSGASGAFVSGSMVAPELWIKTWELWQEGNVRSAKDLAVSISGLHELLQSNDSAANTKAVLNLMGLCEPELRMPYTWPTRATIYQLAAQMELAGLSLQTGELS